MKNTTGNWYSKLKRKFFGTPIMKSEYNLQYAFTIDNVNYYNFVNLHEIPVQRMYAISAIHEEFNMRMTKDDLRVYLDVIKNSINSKIPNISKVIETVKNIEDRLDFVIEIDTVYKLAAAVFIRENENPAKFDITMQEMKIRHFREADIPSFFLSLPLSELHVFSQTSVEEMRNILEKVLRQTERQYNFLKDTYSADSDNSQISLIESQLKQIREYQSALSHFTNL